MNQNLAKINIIVIIQLKASGVLLTKSQANYFWLQYMIGHLQS